MLGPGTTVKAIADSIGVPKTLLGVDAMVDGRPAGADLNEKGILELMDSYEETKLVVTPIGGNGFLFGRGNRQFTPEVLRRVGREGIIVVATRDKLQRLEALRVDAGDFALDHTFSDYISQSSIATERKIAMSSSSRKSCYNTRFSHCHHNRGDCR